MLVTVPGKTQPVSLVGKVSHTILAADEEPPGMGIVFDLDDTQREALQSRDQRARKKHSSKACCRRRRSSSDLVERQVIAQERESSLHELLLEQLRQPEADQRHE